jgi:malectin (di-glucose binding ER protein)
LQYQFTVPSGTYAVTLKYAEIYFTSTGQRTFNVVINGTTVQTNFDIVAAAGGPFTAKDLTFSVTATSTITIQFVPVVQNPKINAIQIVKTG